MVLFPLSFNQYGTTARRGRRTLVHSALPRDNILFFAHFPSWKAHSADGQASSRWGATRRVHRHARKCSRHRGSGRKRQDGSFVARYREVLACAEIGAAVWLSPTHRSAADVRGRLLSADLRACFRPAVMTFAQFAERVLAASDRLVQPITELAKRQIIRRLIFAAAKAGRLQHFQSIAGTSGLVDLVAEFIGELKRSEIWPDDFEGACASAAGSEKIASFCNFIWRIRIISTRNSYTMRRGVSGPRGAPARRANAPFEPLRHIVVDGFTDFTRTQHEILEILAQRVDALWLSLPLEANDDRPDLFAKPQRTLARLRLAHPSLVVELLPRADRPAWPALAHVERELFKSPRLVRPAADASGIEVIEAARAMDELGLIGRRIKQLLVVGDPVDGRPVRPGDVAIVMRSPAALAAVFRETFAELGLPYALEDGRPLAQVPATVALIALVRLHIEDWPYRSVVALLDNNYFQPDWPEWQGGRAAAAASTTIRALQIARGRAALLAALARAGEEADPHASDESAAAARGRAHDTLAVVKRLAAVFNRLPQQATPGAWAHALAALAGETGLLRACDRTNDEAIAKLDRAAWDQLIAALAAAERFAPRSGSEPDQIDLAGLYDLLLDIARTSNCANRPMRRAASASFRPPASGPWRSPTCSSRGSPSDPSLRPSGPTGCTAKRTTSVWRRPDYRSYCAPRQARKKCCYSTKF